MKNFLLFLSVFIAFSGALQAQNVDGLFSPQEVRADIARRGLDVNEVETRMKLRGFDVNTMTPAQIPAAQAAFQEIVKQMEAEKAATTKEVLEQKVEVAKDQAEKAAANATQQVAQQAAEEIQQKVAEGMGVQAAVAEALVDNAKPLPKSPIYGHNLFRDRSLEIYKGVNDLNVPADYVLGPGDKLVVAIWGSIANFTENLEVGQDGYANPNNLPRAFLRGSTYTKAKAQLRAIYSQRFPVSSGNFEVSLNYSRTIDVTISGEVENYGSYKLSALNTAFHALVASGGPTEIGTVRKIIIYRSGQPKRTMDVYAYMLDPTISKNYYLENGDNIYVPASERVIEIAGAVKRPSRYELLKGENLLKLIEWAGGLRSDAYTTNIQISRFSNQTRSILDINLQELIDKKKDLDLVDGDIVSIKAVAATLENYVEIDGEVLYPDRYSLGSTPRLSDLVTKAGMKKETRMDFASLIRAKSDGGSEYLSVNLKAAIDNPADTTVNIALRPKDRLSVSSLGRYVDNYTVESQGAVRSPRSLPYDNSKSMRIYDLVMVSGGLNPDAADFAYIFRVFPDRPKEQTSIRINLKEVLANPASSSNVLLEPSDRLFIPSKGAFVESYTVKSDGALRSPREIGFDVNKSMRISNLIELSDGLKVDAADFGYVFQSDPSRPKEQTYKRVDIQKALAKPGSVDDIILMPNDRLFIPSKGAFLESYTVKSDGAVRNPREIGFDASKTLRISNLVELSDGVKPEATDFGYIFHTDPTRPKEQTYQRVDIKKAIMNPGSSDDVVLLPNDRLVILSKGLFKDEYNVRVSGSVRNPGEHRWDPSLSLQDVLTLAGGVRREAATNRVEIFRTVFAENQPTQVTVGTFSIDTSDFSVKGGANFGLQPYDIITVRNVPEFELPKMVTLGGEVRYPGEYALINKNEKLANVIQRAGGLSSEAFAKGATLKRSQDGMGYVIIRMEKALRNKRSNQNIVLKAGDVIMIPKAKDLVTVKGATKAFELFPDKIIGNGGAINVAHYNGKRAKFYVKKYAAGFGENADRNSVVVEKPNGQIKRTKHLGFIRIYPKVPKGGVVSIGVKSPEVKAKEEETQKKNIDWNSVLADTLAKVTSVVTLLVLLGKI